MKKTINFYYVIDRVPTWLLTLLSIFLIYTIASSMAAYSCTQSGKFLNRNTQYTFFNGCLVETNSGWIQKKYLRYELNER